MEKREHLIHTAVVCAPTAENVWGRNLHEFRDFTATHESILHEFLGMPHHFCDQFYIPRNAPFLPILKSFPLYGITTVGIYSVQFKCLAPACSEEWTIIVKKKKRWFCSCVASSLSWMASSTAINFCNCDVFWPNDGVFLGHLTVPTAYVWEPSQPALVNIQLVLDRAFRKGNSC